MLEKFKTFVVNLKDIVKIVIKISLFSSCCGSNNTFQEEFEFEIPDISIPVPIVTLPVVNGEDI